MFFKRHRRKPSAPPAEETMPQPMDPALYGRLVDGELPTGWLEFHSAFLSSQDAMLRELDQESNAAPDTPSAIALHEQYLAAFDAYRTECEARSECFVKYFSDTHGGQDIPHRRWLEEHTTN